MKTKAQKKENIDALAKALPGASITIFTTFARGGEQGLSVAQLQELKRALRQADGEYVVAKKTLIDKAMQELKYDGIDVFGMDGSMGLVLAHGDVYAIAKQLYQFAKANPALKLFAAWTDGHAMSQEQLIEMATLPSRDELIARLLGMLQYPVKSLAIVLDQVAKGKGAAAPAEAPAPAPVEVAAEAPVAEPVAEAAAPAEEVATS
ncbi:MAG: 50S ribosomal protein L10 [Candidatus Yanofskybacteria bacterium]|nr:50S ribosomal protein L10 [Candidatus Yanofskybacteria bacterium]